jgi:uncharacterized protein (DUF58 family)
MFTSRAWWTLFFGWVTLVLGLFLPMPALQLTGLTILLWFAGEWLLFAAAMVGQAKLQYEVLDNRGPVTALWAGQSFLVRVRLKLRCLVAWRHAAISGPVPFGVEVTDGITGAEGDVVPGQVIEWAYRIHCPTPGIVRWEGVRIDIADLQGCFYHSRFVRAPLVLRVLPALSGDVRRGPGVKRDNLLLPPGIHRLKNAGSGSELLDLRDYRPGDPPRTIAWKVSARRDRLITKEFESEVPVRCMLFVDTSDSVRLAAPAAGPRGQGGGKPLHRLVDLAAGIIQTCTTARDPVGLCLCDEEEAFTIRPDRTGPHRTQMLHHLAEAAALDPASAGVHPDRLLPLAYSFASEVYPDLLHPSVNAVPFWFTALLSFPGYQRRLRNLWEGLYHRKRMMWVVLSLVSTVALLFAATWKYIFALSKKLIEATSWLPWWALLALGALPLLAVICLPLIGYLFVLRVNRLRQRHAVWRKRLAALLSVRYGLAPGGVELLMEDDDVFVLLVQRFLNEHRVPYTLPLYDGHGRYRFAAPQKVGALAKALREAVGRGRDNELFVLLADLLELDDALGPLLQTVRMALARHHQIIVVCPWPPGLPPPPREPDDALRQGAASQKTTALWDSVMASRLYSAYARLRRTFGKMGVSFVCAAGDDAVPLVLERIEQLRLQGGRHR